MTNFEFLMEKAGDFNIQLTGEQLEKFREYWKFLDEYNKHTNLVSSTEPETVILRHFMDSLALGLASQEIELNRQLNIVDIGIGGGFPGIPLIIAFPQWKLCAVDSIAKKIEFVRILCEKLELAEQVEIVNARAEELGKIPEKREFFDIAMTRAVARMNIISEYCIPLVKKEGYFVAYKAKLAEEEIKEAQGAISILGGEYVSTVSYTLTGEEERNLMLIKKIKSTPADYPRKIGIPAKKPLYTDFKK